MLFKNLIKTDDHEIYVVSEIKFKRNVMMERGFNNEKINYIKLMVFVVFILCSVILILTKVEIINKVKFFKIYQKVQNY